MHDSTGKMAEVRWGHQQHGRVPKSTHKELPSRQKGIVGEARPWGHKQPPTSTLEGLENPTSRHCTVTTTNYSWSRSNAAKIRVNIGKITLENAYIRLE